MKKTLGRRALSILLLILLLLPTSVFLYACHGSRGIPVFEMPEEFDTSRQYDITFWAKNDTNKTQTLIYEKAIRDFQSLYPNITVNLRLYTDYGRIYNDVITNIPTRTTPNVCITYPDHIATYLTGENVVVPLDSLIADEEYGLGGSEVRFDSVKTDEIIPQFLGECRFASDGNCYALPFMRSTEACYVNKTYVEALGFTLPEVLTWDFIWEVSEAATAKNPDGTYAINGQKVMIPFIYKSTDNMMIQFLRQAGAGYSDATGQVLFFNDTTASFLRTVAAHTGTGAFSTFKISGYPANFLNAGQCIFAVDSTAGATWMGTDAPLCDISADKIVKFETVVFPVPQIDPEKPQMISQGPSVCVFNQSDPQEVLASWLFTQYLLTNEVQIAYAETEGYVPVTLKAQNDASYLSYLAAGGTDNNAHYRVKIDATRLLLDRVSQTFITPVFNGSASLRDAAGQLIENVVKSVKRHEQVDDSYMSQLFADVSSLFRLDQLGAAGDSLGAGEKELGALPPTAAALLVSLGVAWLLLLAYLIFDRIRQKKKRINEKK